MFKRYPVKSSIPDTSIVDSSSTWLVSIIADEEIKDDLMTTSGLVTFG